MPQIPFQEASFIPQVYFTAANPIEARERIHNGTFDMLDENSPRAEQPMDISIHLKPHQLSAMHAIRTHENLEGDISTKMGVFCDKVGAGKTYTMLAHLSTNPTMQSNVTIPTSFGSIVSFVNRVDMYDIIDTNLIVVPHSIVSQWRNSLTLFPCRSYVISKKSQLLDCIERYSEYRIIVVSSSFYKQVHMQCMGYKVHRVIFDEADSLSIPKCEKIMANFYWFVTSSVSNLVYPNGMYIHNQRRVEGVRGNDFVKHTFQSILSFPLIDRLFLKNKDEFVDTSFRLPEPQFCTLLCKTPGYMNVIGQFASPKVVECLNAGDVSGAMQSLRDSGISVNTGEHILQVLANSFQVKIQNLEKTLDYVRTLDIPEREKEKRIESCAIEMNSLRTRNETLQQKLKSIDDQQESCPICYDTLGEPSCMLWCCNNVFCYDCIRRLTSRSSGSTCPFCRSALTLDSVRVIHKGKDTGTSPKNSCLKEPKMMTKLETLRSIFRNSPDGKFLVFSSHDTTFERIRDYLEDEIQVSRPVGSSSTIEKRIREFEEGTTRVLLLNSQHLGSGLNLQCATHVIFFHSMSRTMEQQVIGRAQRAGREGPLQVIHLLHTNEQN